MRIGARFHRIIDYLVVLFLWLSPTIFGLSPKTAMFTYILGGIHLVLTVCTNTKMGLLRIVPFRVHGWIELVVSIALVGVAFYLGNLEGDVSRNFYLGFAAAVFAVFLLTDYKSAV